MCIHRMKLEYRKMIVKRSMVVRWMSLTFIGSTLNFTDKSQETMVLICFNAVRTVLYVNMHLQHLTFTCLFSKDTMQN